jgi:hypothetical protein
MNARRFATGFRIAATAQAIALFTQAVLAGLALSGNPIALTAHMLNGAATLLASGVQTGLAVILWRSRQLPRWAVIASVLLLTGHLSQMMSGRFQAFALHIPLGVGLFGVVTVLVYWAWSSRPERSATSLSVEPRGGSYA